MVDAASRTLTLKVDGEQAFTRLRSAAMATRTPREAALDHAIASLPHNAGHEAIVSRAETFLAFLDPEA